MTTHKGLLPVFGAATFGSSIKTPEDVDEALQSLQKNGCHHIDTAYIYSDGASEVALGNAGAGGPKWGFNIDTKAPGGIRTGSCDRQGVANIAKESLERLQLGQVDVFYLHAPDDSTPLEETLAGVNDSYKAGHFKRFGISNFSPEEVQKVYDTCKAKGYVLPSVYQGNYNAVARKPETELLPLLRKLGMPFYAYSPSAGGVLSRTTEQLLAGGEGSGRFNEKHQFGFMYRALYNRPGVLKGIEEWTATAEAAGISRIEMAYRWVTFNSALKPEHGDAIIFGASKIPQIESTLTWIKKGPLDESTVKRIDHIWEMVKDEAPFHNMEAFKK